MARIFYFFFAAITILSSLSLFLLKFDVYVNVPLNQKVANTYVMSGKNSWKRLKPKSSYSIAISTMGSEICKANVSTIDQNVVVVTCPASVVYPKNLDSKIIIHQCPLLDVLMTKFE